MTTPPDWVHDGNTALFTDLYQLTMLQAYFVEGLDGEAVFDLFVRRLRKRNYLVACGLETCLRYLETLRFTEDYCGCQPDRCVGWYFLVVPVFVEWIHAREIVVKTDATSG